MRTFAVHITDYDPWCWFEFLVPSTLSVVKCCALASWLVRGKDLLRVPYSCHPFLFMLHSILRVLFMNACVTLCISLNCSLGLILIRIPETGFSMLSRATSLKPSQPHPRSFCVESNNFCNNSLNCGSYRGHRRMPNCYLAFSQGGKRGE